jgi:hypothetical protein
MDPSNGLARNTLPPQQALPLGPLHLPTSFTGRHVYPTPSTAGQATRIYSLAPTDTAFTCPYCFSKTRKLLHAIRPLFRLLLLPRSQLILENLALRQQLAVLSRQRPRSSLCRRDRLFWICLSKLYSGWRSALVLVQPDTVIRWYRQGFRLWWRWRSQTKRAGRPSLDKEIRDLIASMARDNPTWARRESRPNRVCWVTRSPKRPWPSRCLCRNQVWPSVAASANAGSPRASS